MHHKRFQFLWRNFHVSKPEEIEDEDKDDESENEEAAFATYERVQYDQDMIRDENEQH